MLSLKRKIWVRHTRWHFQVNKEFFQRFKCCLSYIYLSHIASLLECFMVLVANRFDPSADIRVKDTFSSVPRPSASLSLDVYTAFFREEPNWLLASTTDCPPFSAQVCAKPVSWFWYNLQYHSQPRSFHAFVLQYFDFQRFPLFLRLCTEVPHNAVQVRIKLEVFWGWLYHKRASLILNCTISKLCKLGAWLEQYNRVFTL